jgi:chromosome segregation ATPase
MELRPDPLWQELKVPPVEPIHEATNVQQLLAENGLLRTTVAHLREHSSALRNVEINEGAIAQFKNELAVQSDQLAVQSDQLAVQSDQLAASQKHVLQARDQIIGLTARQAELDHRLRIARSNNDKLRRELKDVFGSRTWKLGRLLMLPVRVVRRVISKLK